MRGFGEVIFGEEEAFNGPPEQLPRKEENGYDLR
jgi:hypothetical protein